MGGVYRIQTFFGFLYFFYICKAPYRVRQSIASPQNDQVTAPAGLLSSLVNMRTLLTVL